MWLCTRTIGGAGIGRAMVRGGSRSGGAASGRDRGAAGRSGQRYDARRAGINPSASASPRPAPTWVRPRGLPRPAAWGGSEWAAAPRLPEWNETVGAGPPDRARRILVAVPAGRTPVPRRRRAGRRGHRLDPELGMEAGGRGAGLSVRACPLDEQLPLLAAGRSGAPRASGEGRPRSRAWRSCPKGPAAFSIPRPAKPNPICGSWASGRTAH